MKFPLNVGLALVMGAQVTRKVARLYLVSRAVWAEVAAWRSSHSSLPPWSFQVFRFGFRVTTPLVGFSIGVWL